MYKTLVRPTRFMMGPENAHKLALQALARLGKTYSARMLVKRFYTVENLRLSQKLFDHTFPNPVGLAAGMDKSGIALLGFEALGFGHLEMGGITRYRQDGNPLPRLFLIEEDEAIINRMGFNNPGAKITALRLSQTQGPIVPLGINIGKSKAVPPENIKEVVEDYLYTLRALYEYGDFFTLNVSSPNTPNLRKLQAQESLRAIATAAVNESKKLAGEGRFQHKPKPILVKIAPDLTLEEIDDILEVTQSAGLAGIIAVNTTTARTGLTSKRAIIQEIGGLSGKPLKRRALEIVGHIRAQCPTLPIIGVGGISSGEDAYNMLRAGANIIQIFTGLVYEGLGLPKRINQELLKFMDRDGISCIKDIREMSLSVTR
ncbi:MAG: dihydroorotate dehydrogenase (quinone) [Candidatus Ryanbacteria bacterium RIFCSPLOWO2_01_FULL_48_26]|uniref:Dihydroorotate dehydrogenase (quinone) n=1 Tax=Candidatus Ryanbacteria bacterium RIFCSPLOWO2_01_FULL_48_26 TaxID=1802126 RepID=A0A1G2GQN2_9BACT|nr:MAG: dihydroorotate dehydrogenase (quinone) [Candidatus Ryanbacteria bacterium RIFCSPLOWO2_01_FULL_48_26]